jgi:hypothetical protein
MPVGSQPRALVNRNKIPKSNSDLTKAQERLKLVQDIDRRSNRLGARAMQKWFHHLSILAVALAILLKTATLYKSSQKTIINRNTIRKGKATADTAEAAAKINGNNIEKSKYEAQKLKAHADSAESLALAKRNSAPNKQKTRDCDVHCRADRAFRDLWR